MKVRSLRIILIGPSFPFRGGIPHYTTLLFNHLKKNNDVIFYTFKKQYPNWLFPGKDDRDQSHHKIVPTNTHASKDGSSYSLTIKRTLHPLNPIPWIKAGLAARSYDLILLPWWTIFWAPHYILFLTFAKSNRNKIVFLCHNVEEHESGRFKKILSRLTLKKGDGFILHSNEEKRSLCQLVEKRPPSVVSPHPIYRVFNSNRYSVSSAREKLEIPFSRKVILFFGFIRKYKGLPYLLKALPIVKNHYPDILLFIVGEAWGDECNPSKIESTIHELGISENVRFINRYIPNEDIELYFKAADFAVLPYIEGTGSGILQICYGMGKPVVATYIGTFNDFVVNGKTGILVAPADEIKLAGAIIRMYNDGVIGMMEEEIKRYSERFEWKYMVKNILSLYHDLK